MDAVLECLYRTIETDQGDGVKSKAPSRSRPRSRRVSVSNKGTAPQQGDAESGEKKAGKARVGTHTQRRRRKEHEPRERPEKRTTPPPAPFTPAPAPEPATSAPTQNSGWFGRLSSWYYSTPTKAPETSDAAVSTEEHSESETETSAASLTDGEEVEEAEFYSGSDAEDEEGWEDPDESEGFHDVDDAHATAVLPHLLSLSLSLPRPPLTYRVV